MNAYGRPYGSDFCYGPGPSLWGADEGAETFGVSEMRGWIADKNCPIQYTMSMNATEDGIYTLSCEAIELKVVNGMVVTPIVHIGDIAYDSNGKKVISNTMTAELRKRVSDTMDGVIVNGYGFPNISNIRVQGDIIAHCFAAKVLKETKPYCYKAVSESNAFFNATGRHTILTISNILSGVFDYADELEKTLKISPRTVKDGWTTVNIENILTVKRSKVPPALLTWANKQSCPTQLLGVFQSICNHEDANNAVIFQKFFKALKKLGLTESIKNMCTSFSEVLEMEEGYTTKKLIDYLIRQTYFYGEFKCPAKECADLADYISMATAAGLEYDHYPANISKSHNIMVRNMDALKLTEEEQKAFEKYNTEMAEKYDITYGDYVVILPKRVEELVKEGNDLNHCVAGYARRIARKQTLVGFLRKKDTPDMSLYTLEINDKGKVIQAKGACNEDVPQEINKLIEKIERSWNK